MKATDLMNRLAQPPVGRIMTAGLQLAQGTIMAGALLGYFRPEALGIILLPWALSKIYTNPRGLQWLTTGLAPLAPVAPGATRRALPESRRAWTQLLGFLAREAQQDNAAGIDVPQMLLDPSLDVTGDVSGQPPPAINLPPEARAAAQAQLGAPPP